MKAIINGRILTKDNVIEDKNLLFDDKIIGFCEIAIRLTSHLYLY